jgi:hypothetical protein
VTRLTRAVFSVSWIWTYPRILSSGDGELMSFTGYRSQFNRFGRPWHADTSWSTFWASYQASDASLRNPSTDVGWDYMVPLWWDPHADVEGPPGTSVQDTVLLYPAAVAVVVRVEAEGSWAPRDLASHLYDLRKSNAWTLVTPNKITPNRSLAGIATDLRDASIGFVVGDGGEPSVPTLLTVAAPLSGTGAAEELDLAHPDVRGAVAGLANVGPPGKLVETNLLKANTDPELAARMYVTSKGHVLWHPASVLAPSPTDPLGCLHRNHTSLVVQIAALSDVVSWAHEAIAAQNPIAGGVRQVVKRAVGRLNRLEEGNPKKTYRSGVAKVRIAPLRPQIDAVQRLVGTT